MPFKDVDGQNLSQKGVPAIWNYDNTREAVVLTQKELKALRDQLNAEYLRRWSGIINNVHTNNLYMDYQKTTTEFTDADGKHVNRLPNWNGALNDANPYGNANYQMADGNVNPTYWSARTTRDFRGCPAYYSPLDRYIDGVVSYNRASNTAPTVSSDYKGPDPGQTLPLGTSEWRNSDKYQPHGVTDVTKDRAFKHIIDGLANILDIDKYFGHGIISGDPVNPYNPVNYGADQTPANSERVSHSWRQTGMTSADNMPGATQEMVLKQGSIKDWIAILQRERRNDYYIRACNYQHWIWYFENRTHNKRWGMTSPVSASYGQASSGSWSTPRASGPGRSPGYSVVETASYKHRINYNPSYYGHREAYTSCLQACTGFCSQTCFHVCDEQCVYLCDDACGYSCMSYGKKQQDKPNCGATCISNCSEFCGGVHQDGSSYTTQGSCSLACSNKAANALPGLCTDCHGSCQKWMMDEQACSRDCVGFCSMGCDSICVSSCTATCKSDSCRVSCAGDCNEKGSKYSSCCDSKGKKESGKDKDNECEDEDEDTVGKKGDDDDDDWDW